MDINRAKEHLDSLERELFAYRYAMSSIGLDARTAAPPETQEGRGVALGILSARSHELMTSEDLWETVNTIYDNRDEAGPEYFRRSEILRKELADSRAVPAEEHAKLTQLLSESQYVWHKAKAANDYESFGPYIDKLVAARKHIYELTRPGMDPFDAALDAFEEGTSREYYDSFFEELRATLVPLISKVNAAGQPDDSWLHVSYPIEQQRKLSQILMDAFCLDRNHCSITETEHPFTGGPTSQDVRITTHYYEFLPIASVYSVIHEGGHANYELHVDPAYDYNCLKGGTSMAVHESQSRFWENYVGRSKEFTDWLWPRFRDLFPEQTAGKGADDFYRCINKAQPGLIRTEADELTYPMHIMVRYELEKKLFTGELTSRDLPDAWNGLYKDYLGVDVPDHTRGVLQDIHWSSGSFGYFPTYALGTAYSAQILSTMKKDLDFSALVAADDMQPILAWLTEKLYHFGSLIKPGDVVPSICGAPFTAKFFTDYLTDKFSNLYDL